MQVIVDFEFLSSFFLKDDDSDRHFYLTRLLTSVDSPAEIIVNFDFEAVYSDPEKRAIFRKIAQKMPISDLTILEKAKQKEFYESKNASLFFVNDENLDVEQFGAFSITTKQLERADNFLQSEDLRIDSQKKDWAFLSRFKIPCNAIILTDNYLFSNDVNYENMISILKSLMPSRLSIEFHLTIIGSDPKKAFKSISDQHRSLLSKLSHLPYHVNLTIIREDHHGRYIHTNYTRFHSEKGFGLFENGKISKSDETSIAISSVFSFTKNSYQTWKAEIEKCEKINRVERIADRLTGNRINRLLVKIP